jgi:pimeloyl-ACP methyl ester carboxylesterase
MKRLEYEERGSGPVICLAHAGVFSAWFTPMFEDGALDGCRVIRLVRPGYGRSAPPTEAASLRAQAGLCADQLAELGAVPAYWVGHSSSCCIGLQLALDHPDLVAGLILFETAKPSGPLREASAGTYVGPALAAAREGDVPGAFDVFMRGVGGKHYRSVLIHRFGEEGLSEAEHESAYFFADELPAIGAWQFGEVEAARVTAPTLLVNGATSRPWFAENMAVLAAWLPDATSLTIDGASHLAPLTHASDLAVAAARFARRRSPASTAKAGGTGVGCA